MISSNNFNIYTCFELLNVDFLNINTLAQVNFVKINSEFQSRLEFLRAFNIKKKVFSQRWRCLGSFILIAFSSFEPI
jgi:hypothetical protein